MESGDLGLAESIASYEQGVALLRRLHDELSGIELRVQTLVRLDDDGNPVFEPIAGQSAPAAQANESVTKARPARGRRRSRKPATEDNKSRQRLPGMDEPSETP
jgi:exodeoxyribonuclease VII small subunit